jgi:8-oxo-dGTP diphosphatase
MRVRADAGWEADHEIDDVRWVALSSASGLLSYAHDRGVLAAFAALPRITAELTVVRHAQAGSREAWQGSDLLRPLDVVGHQQIEALTPLLRLTAPDQIVSATAQRCRETVVPLAESLGLAVKVDPAFDEEAPGGVPGAAAAALALAADGGSTVICSHRRVIPPLLRLLRPANATKIEEFRTPKGDAWLLAFAGTAAVSADPFSV